MCGICGSTMDPRGDAVRRMADRMTHRGPDDEGFHVDPSGVALGARRLSIIDVEGGHQPLRNEDGTVWAVLNGEIYNHPAAARPAARRGHVFASQTDTEVLVHLYEDYGADMVHALEGMYAFADLGRAQPGAAARPRPLRREAAVLLAGRRRAGLRLRAHRARRRRCDHVPDLRPGGGRRLLRARLRARHRRRPRGASSSCRPGTSCAGAAASRTRRARALLDAPAALGRGGPLARRARRRDRASCSTRPSAAA